MSQSYKNLQVETHGSGAGQVGLIRLHRPDALNALCHELMDELTDVLRGMEADDNIGAIVLTGSDKAFAAGADIKEMADKGFADVYNGNFITSNWEEVVNCRKPVIAAVAGYALGGGCELAMMCDMILAADSAKFGQPEITIGTTPGAGGSQRLTRFIGKSKSMEMCLTGRMMGAEEAERSGLVARVIEADKLVEEALSVAGKIAGFSRPVVMAIKEAVNYAYESHMGAGVRFERNIFYGTFALEDRAEGMTAFVEKRDAKFKNR